MKKKISITGNAGPKVRSDCELSITLTEKTENIIKIDSKVISMYGTSIKNLIEEILKYFEVSGAEVNITDKGALPFVIAARVEAGIKQLLETEKEYLLDIIPENEYSSENSRYRFSRLYLPGNTPSMMLNAGLHSPDGIILDLEDSVAQAKKEEARYLVRNVLRSLNFYGVERMVRINQGKVGLYDLKYIVPHNVHLILVPKCESADYIKELEGEIERIKKLHKVKKDIFLMPILESALGIENAFEIAKASKNIVALAIGLEDYTADLGVQRTISGEESLYARMRMVNASKAAGVQPIDSVFSDVSDMEALRETVLKSKAMGFEGMGCIHPRQINVIRKAFAPDTKEIDKASKIVLAFKEAEKMGLGVVSLGSKMIDPPVVIRALRTIKLAAELNLIGDDWEANTEE
jgi:citrate lyase subunit beta/citryl-CoA lyase